jgi:hypothetical protein
MLPCSTSHSNHLEAFLLLLLLLLLLSLQVCAVHKAPAHHSDALSG